MTAPLHDLAPEDESWLSSMSALMDLTQGPLCRHCGTTNGEPITLANNRTGIAVVHDPECPLADQD